jgi:hypothetical protein
MDVREYRRRYEAELAAHAAAARTAAVSEPARGTPIPDLLAALRDGRASASARLEALHDLLTVRFLGSRFAPYNADFLAALREIVRPGTDRELCQAALEVLALDKDPHAQELLKRGLTDPQAALVPAAKALQFLAYDDHAGATNLARDIFHRTTDTATKEEALRVLASDPQSADLFAGLLKDKSQPRSIRALSVSGLNNVNPQAFAEVARTIVPDDQDYDDIRATVIGALAHVVDPAHMPKDQGFVKRVEELGAKSTSANVRSAVGRFMENLQQ